MALRNVPPEVQRRMVAYWGVKPQEEAIGGVSSDQCHPRLSVLIRGRVLPFRSRRCRAIRQSYRGEEDFLLRPRTRCGEISVDYKRERLRHGCLAGSCVHGERVSAGRSCKRLRDRRWRGAPTSAADEGDDRQERQQQCAGAYPV